MVRISPWFKCRKCGKTHIFPSFVLAITCKCGEVTTLSQIAATGKTIK